jgi:hypothetical protein
MLGLKRSFHDRISQSCRDLLPCWIYVPLGFGAIPIGLSILALQAARNPVATPWGPVKRRLITTPA